MNRAPIGVFDSGIGGISVLRNMVRLLPNENFIYFGDDKNAPYGTKTEEEILSLSVNDVNFLLEKGAKAVVIACNTATSASAAYLRENLDLPIIGMEPALKPASMVRKNGMIGVLATPATLRQKKFRLLMEKYGQYALPIPCPGLMEFVERGEIYSENLLSFLKELFKDYSHENLDAAVLGCTHYVFLKKAVSEVLKGVELFDGNEGTARQLKNVLSERGLLSDAVSGSVEMHTSGEKDRILPLMRALFAENIV